MTVHEPELRPAEIPSAAADPTEASGILTIDLGAVAANWKTLASMTVPVECAAVVKGDGYGCGLEPVTHTLSRAGCSTFFVADVAEGRRVRAIAPDAAIYVLNGVMPGSAQARSSTAPPNLRNGMRSSPPETGVAATSIPA